MVEGLVVGSLIQQGIERSGVSDLDLSDPAFILRAGVDGLGVVLENGVTPDDLASHRGQHIGSRLDRLDSADGLTGTNLEVFLRQLNKNNVTQRVSGVLGDTDLGCTVLLIIEPFIDMRAAI